MKLAMFCATLFAAVLAAGCQDNTMTGPAESVVSPASPLGRDITTNTLSINTVLREPGAAFNSFVAVSGQVQYTTQLVPLDPAPPNPQFAVAVELNIQMDLAPYESNGPVWGVLASSEDWVPFSDDADHSLSLTKRYTIEGRSDDATLNIRFIVNEASVSVDRMWLEVLRGTTSAASNN